MVGDGERERDRAQNETTMTTAKGNISTKYSCGGDGDISRAKLTFLLYFRHLSSDAEGHSTVGIG